MQQDKSRNYSILFFLFFISGIAALIYQVSWQRLLTYYTGSDTASVSLIVSAYMVGLGLGSLVGGYWSDRLSNKKRLLFFGLSEALIGGFALISKWLFYDYLYGILTVANPGDAIVFMILFAVLLVPTFLMGASLPILSKAYLRSLDESVLVIGKLYFVNTLGASLGALMPIILVRFYGFSSTIILASLLNFLCFFVSVYLITTFKKIENKIENAADSGKIIYSRDFIFWIATYCLTGFIAVSFEVVWFRMLSVIIKPIYLTFPIMLSIFIGGLALGSTFNRYIPKQYSQKAILFFLSQLFIAFYVFISVVFFVYGVKYIPFLSLLNTYLSSYDPNTKWYSFVFLYGILIPYFILIPTMVMGFSFIVLQSLLQDNYFTVGRKLGLAQFMNILGSGLGAICTSYLFINYWGTAVTFKIIILLSFSLVLTAFIMYRNIWKVRNVYLYFIVLCFPLAYFILPAQLNFWSMLHGKDEARIIVEEDASGVAAIKLKNTVKDDDIVFCNGLGQSIIKFNAEDLHVYFGLLPALLHPNPEDVAIIGLGSGSTLYGAGGRPETKSITCFEIVTSQKKTLEQYQSSYPNNGLKSILNDPRINFSFGDARYNLKISDKKYDIIEADALRVNSAYSGNLYSKEYFQLIKSKLKTGGMAVTWAPTQRIYRTVTSVFKNTLFYNNILIASDTPIIINREQLLSKSKNAYTRVYYNQTGINIYQFLVSTMSTYKVANNVKVFSDDINTDLYPKDEFGLPDNW
ncbi:MAG: spermidine synthase [Pyrinomonadaceae bacterium]|nr:spermidine synthase [Sphingobacteriaceae bacterium]